MLRVMPDCAAAELDDAEEAPNRLLLVVGDVLLLPFEFFLQMYGNRSFSSSVSVSVCSGLPSRETAVGRCLFLNNLMCSNCESKCTALCTVGVDGTLLEW